MRMFSRWLAAAAVAGVCLSACTDTTVRTLPAAEPVRVGILAPLSGPDAPAGVDAVQGARLAADVVNDRNPSLRLPLARNEGLAGLDGARLSLTIADSTGDTDRATTEALRLTSQERVSALVLAEADSVAAAAAQRTERMRIPVLDARSSAGYLTALGLDWYFRTAASDEMIGEAAFSLLRRQQSDTAPGRVAILHSSDPRAITLTRTVQQLAANAGHQVVADVTVDDDSPSPGGGSAADRAVTQLTDAEPDAVVAVAASVADATTADAVLRDADLSAPVLGWGPGYSDAALKRGPAGTYPNLLRIGGWSTDYTERNPTAQAVARLYAARYGEAITEPAVQAFTAVLTLAIAMDEAGTASAGAVRSALINLRLPGGDTIMPWDGVRFSAGGQNVLAGGVVEQRAGGKFRLVFPPELARTPPVWIRPSPSPSPDSQRP